MLPFAALIAFASSIAFVALCGKGKKDKDIMKTAPVVQKNSVAVNFSKEQTDTIYDIKSSWGGPGPSGNVVETPGGGTPECNTPK